MSSQCNFVEKFSLDGVHPPVRAHECNGWPRRAKTPSEEIVECAAVLAARDRTPTGAFFEAPLTRGVPENQGVSAAWMPGLSVARREWMARHLRHSVPRGKIFYLDSL